MDKTLRTPKPGWATWFCWLHGVDQYSEPETQAAYFLLFRKMGVEVEHLPEFLKDWRRSWKKK